MGEEARMGVGGGPFRKASGVEWKAKNALSSGGSHRQNVIEIEREFDFKKEISKIKDEPNILLKTKEQKSDKMPHPNESMILNGL